MIEQLSLFGDKSTFNLVTEWLVKQYECRRYQWKNWNPNFDEYIRDCFSSYQGGTTDSFLSSEGWTMYNMSPKGVELIDSNTLIRVEDGTEWRKELIPKLKILKAFGIKDDRKDVLIDV